MPAGTPKPLHETITYWGTPQPDGMGGTVFAAPVALLARWEQRVEQTYDAKGSMIISQAVVFTLIDISIGGYLYQGISAAPDPATVTGAFEVKNFVKTPNIRKSDYERRSVL